MPGSFKCINDRKRIAFLFNIIGIVQDYNGGIT